MPKILSNEEIVKLGFNSNNGQKAGPLFSIEKSHKHIMDTVRSLAESVSNIALESSNIEYQIAEHIKSMVDRIQEELKKQHLNTEKEITKLSNQIDSINRYFDKPDEIEKKNEPEKKHEFKVIRDNKGRLQSIIEV